MPKRHFIINVGMARSGTTAAAMFFQDFKDVATPLERKEIKYFFAKDVSVDDYVSKFRNPGQFFFESSPPYTHGGTDRFRNSMLRVKRLADEGAEVTIFFAMRNLLSRAFSHYWHDIGSQYARFGRLWSVKSDDDARRYQLLYDRSFGEELGDPDSEAKLLPDAHAMVKMAIRIFGKDAVKVAFMKQLDPAMDELLAHIGLKDAPPVTTPRITSSAAPLYLFGGPDGRQVEVATSDKTLSVNIPANTCYLFSRHHSERLSGDQYDLERIVAASDKWTRSVETDTLSPQVFAYMRQQAEKMANIPDGCFLAGCKDSLIADLATIPKSLDIKPLVPSPERLLAMNKRN